MKNNLILYDICYEDFIKISSEINGIKKYLNNLNTFNNDDKYEYICAMYKLSDNIVKALFKHGIMGCGISDTNIKNRLRSIHNDLTKLTKYIYSICKSDISDLIFILDSIISELTAIIYFHSLNNTNTIINVINDKDE